MNWSIFIDIVAEVASCPKTAINGETELSNLLGSNWTALLTQLEQRHTADISDKLDRRDRARVTAEELWAEVQAAAS